MLKMYVRYAFLFLSVLTLLGFFSYLHASLGPLSQTPCSVRYAMKKD